MKIKINFHGVIFVLLPWNTERKNKKKRGIQKRCQNEIPQFSRRNVSIYTLFSGRKWTTNTKNFSIQMISTSLCICGGERKHCWIIFLSFAFSSLFQFAQVNISPLYAYLKTDLQRCRKGIFVYGELYYLWYWDVPYPTWPFLRRIFQDFFLSLSLERTDKFAEFGRRVGHFEDILFRSKKLVLILFCQHDISLCFIVEQKCLKSVSSHCTSNQNVTERRKTIENFWAPWFVWKILPQHLISHILPCVVWHFVHLFLRWASGHMREFAYHNIFMGIPRGRWEP